MKFLLLMLVTLGIVATPNIAMEIFKARSQWGYRNHVMVLALT